MTGRNQEVAIARTAQKDVQIPVHGNRAMIDQDTFSTPAFLEHVSVVSQRTQGTGELCRAQEALTLENANRLTMKNRQIRWVMK